MTYKVAICLLIILLSYTGGVLYTCRFPGRISLLKSIRDKFDSMEREMVFSLSALPDICERLGQGEDISGKMFEMAAAEMKQGKNSFDKVWESTTVALLKRTFLKKEHIEVIATQGQGLGEGDIDEQKKCFARINQDMTKLISDAEQEQKKLKKMYMTLFVAAGITLAIILV